MRTLPLLNLFRPARGSAGAALARACEHRLAQWREIPTAPANGQKVGVLLTPWLSTAVPFFSLECALALAQRGCTVTILWDTSDVFGNASNPGEVEEIARLFPALPAHLGVIEVRAIGDEMPAGGGEIADGIIRENAIWKMRGEDRADDFLASRPGLLEATRKHLGGVEHFLRQSGVEWILVPGGLYGLSAAYLAVARQLGIGVSTYDSDVGMLMLSHHGAATHHADIPQSLALLETELRARPERETAIIEAASAELGKRRAGISDYQFQKVAASDRADGDHNILVPLNLRWDSAALSRQRLFPSVAEWLTQLVRWTERTPDARLCIRQHPAERFPETRGSDDLGALLRAAGAERESVRFVAADDAVSTYDLLRTARVVLPFSSTLGVEATMLGIPVVTSTNCYYAPLGFVWDALTVSEYFSRISEALVGQLAVSDAARRRAALVYHLTQTHALMKTFFTPLPLDFPKWTAFSPHALWSLPEPADLLTALVTRTPLSFLRYRRAAEAPTVAHAS